MLLSFASICTFTIFKMSFQFEIHRFLGLLFYLVNPFKGLAHFQVYLRLIRQIHVEGHPPLTRRLISLINLCLYLKGLHFLYLTVQPTLSPLESLLHFNYLSLIFSKSIFNFIAFASIFAIVNVGRRLSFTVNQGLLSSLEGILIHRDGSFFLSGQLAGRSIIKLIQASFLVELNLFHGFLLVMGKLLYFNFL